MNSNQLAVALPECAPKLTQAQVIKATARALDDKNLAEWKAAKERNEQAWAKLRNKAEKLARKRIKDAKCSVRPGWKDQHFDVEFSIRLIGSELVDEIAECNACPLIKRVTEGDFAIELRRIASGRNDAAIDDLLSDPKIRARFLELGSKLMANPQTSAPTVNV